MIENGDEETQTVCNGGNAKNLKIKLPTLQQTKMNKNIFYAETGNKIPIDESYSHKMFFFKFLIN